MSPTHQAIGGASDDELLQRMVATHGERFGPAFWSVFDARAAPRVPTAPHIVDLGCGPGLLLRDLGERYPGAHLYGYDVTPAMISYAKQLTFAGPTTFALLDVTTQALPHDARSVHVVCVSSMLHVLDEPLPVLAEIRRVLAADGVLVLHDWIRQPLAAYLAWRREAFGESDVERRRGYRLFPVHNKYTTEDWRWLLDQARFVIHHDEQVRASHRLFVAGLAT